MIHFLDEEVKVIKDNPLGSVYELSLIIIIKQFSFSKNLGIWLVKIIKHVLFETLHYLINHTHKKKKDFDDPLVNKSMELGVWHRLKMPFLIFLSYFFTSLSLGEGDWEKRFRMYRYSFGIWMTDIGSSNDLARCEKLELVSSRAFMPVVGLV